MVRYISSSNSIAKICFKQGKGPGELLHFDRDAPWLARSRLGQLNPQDAILVRSSSLVGLNRRREGDDSPEATIGTLHYPPTALRVLALKALLARYYQRIVVYLDIDILL